MKVLDGRHAAIQDLRHASEVHMARLGARVFNADELELQCVTCQQIWRLELDEDGKLPFGYWICPNRCNR
jgi:hypothetical protein